MVDFRFDIKPLFPQPIIKVSSNLLPHTFRGDRRQCLDATTKMSEIIDQLGQLSAISQGLTKPVTTAQRLRMSENQNIYLLADPEAGPNGSVLGLLKVGTKDLYLFDEHGQTRKMEQSPSILDFYVHESRQRSGLGKHLFETMLKEEQWTPLKCSVDRPSDKLLGFLGKHYGLLRTIPQANNFVLYEGFFNDVSSTPNGSRNGHAESPQRNNGLHITNSPNTQLFGATYLGDEANKRTSGGGRRHSGNNIQMTLQQQQITQISPNGRYGARRPTCSMAESRQASNPNVGRKYGSEVSLTPSQARQGGMVENARKSPLDALSRTNYRPNDPFQRRSGLQDVDDSFLAANAFARPTRVRNTGEVGSAVAAPAVAPLRVASGQEMQMPPVQATVPVVQQQQPIVQQQQLPPAAVAMPAQQQALPPQQQQPQQYVQPPAAGQPTRHDPYQGGRAHVQHQHQHQHHHSQQQLPPQSQSQAGYEPQQQQQPQQAPMEVPVQAQAAPAQVQQQPQAAPAQLSPRKYAQQQQQQQGYANPPAPTASTAGVPPAAEMCTTCPNCQTTIYLIIHAGGANPGKGGGGAGSAESSSVGNDIAEIAEQLQQLRTAPQHYNVDFIEREAEPEPEPEPEPEAEPEPEPEPEPVHTPSSPHTPTPPAVRSPDRAESIIGDNRKPPAFQLSKQHTGMKNRSFGVGMAVMPSSKMEFNQQEREDFGVVKINRPLGNEVTSPGQDNTDAMSTVSSTGGLTDQGYNDLKFYHNKLW